MNKALWISRKNYLCNLIRKWSDGHGGDDIEFLREHCRQVIVEHADEKIELAIKCYEEMVDKLKYYPERNSIERFKG